MHPAFVGEGFLGISLRQTQLPNALPERAKQGWKGIMHTLECLRCDVFVSTLFA
jgi:hypothetical protein